MDCLKGHHCLYQLVVVCLEGHRFLYQLVVDCLKGHRCLYQLVADCLEGHRCLYQLVADCLKNQMQEEVYLLHHNLVEVFQILLWVDVGYQLVEVVL